LSTGAAADHGSDLVSEPRKTGLPTTVRLLGLGFHEGRDSRGCSTARGLRSAGFGLGLRAPPARALAALALLPSLGGCFAKRSKGETW
jgi:hypothetical protein